MAKHLIWESTIDEDSWQDVIKEEMDNGASYDEAYETCIYLNEIYWGDEKTNLDLPCEILAIADLGTWRGRVSAYQLFDNLNACLDSHCNGYLEVYVDDGVLETVEYHHDGTNIYKYFVVRDGKIGTKGFEKFLEDIADGKAISSRRMSYFLKSAGNIVGEIYGWQD